MWHESEYMLFGRNPSENVGRMINHRYRFVRSVELSTMSSDTLARAQGALLGLACGDALGRPVEFLAPERIRERHGRVDEMLGYGTHRQPAGTITDDTEMALCIARSLVDRGGFDPADVADRFVVWLASGPFDVGIMTANALGRIGDGEPWDVAGVREWESSPEGSNAGNGSLMRCLPHAIACRDDPDALVRVSRQSSSSTHADPRCQWACAAYNLTIAGLMTGREDPLVNVMARMDAMEEMDSVDAIGEMDAMEVPSGEMPDEVHEAVRSVIEYQAGELDDLELRNSGYVVSTLEAGLYHGLTAESAEEAIVNAVMMGGDTDTIGAVTGGVAGARFGIEGLPERWVEALSVGEEIEELGEGLVEV